MLIDQIKKRMFDAIKAKNTIEKEVLRTAVGEVTRTGEDATDERVIAVLRKMIKSNEETLSASTDPTQRANLEQELTILNEFVPKSLSVEQIQTALEPVSDQIRAAGNDGQATGIAMKHLKSQGAEVSGKDVSQAVRSLRQT